MPETTKIHVYTEGRELIKEYALLASKELGMKVSDVQATMMLLKAGYKSRTGKDYKPKKGKS